MEKIGLGLDKIENTIKVSTDFIKSYYTHTHMYNEMLVYEPFDGYVTVNNEKIHIMGFEVIKSNFFTPEVSSPFILK